MERCHLRRIPTSCVGAFGSDNRWLTFARRDPCASAACRYIGARTWDHFCGLSPEPLLPYCRCTHWYLAHAVVVKGCTIRSTLHLHHLHLARDRQYRKVRPRKSHSPRHVCPSLSCSLFNLDCGRNLSLDGLIRSSELASHDHWRKTVRTLRISLRNIDEANGVLSM